MRILLKQFYLSRALIYLALMLLGFISLSVGAAETKSNNNVSAKVNPLVNDAAVIEDLLRYAASGDLNSVKKIITTTVTVNAHDSVFNATALHNAAAQGHLNIVQWLVSQGADIDAYDVNDSTPLIWAAYHGEFRVVKYLVGQHADVNQLPSVGPTALIAAIQSDSKQTVQILLENDAQVLLTNNEGFSVLEAAELHGNKTIIMLIKRAMQR